MIWADRNLEHQNVEIFDKVVHNFGKPDEVKTSMGLLQGHMF